MTQFLPPNLLALFAPREPIPYLPPVDRLPYEKTTSGYTGIAEFVKNFEDPSQTPEPAKIRTREERRAEKRQQKAEATAYKLEQDIALWAPHKNPVATTEPRKTLFVARINYDTSEAKLRREFEMYGPIRKIVMVHNLKNKPRGYAFIEYVHERDMHSAYKHADGKKIEGRRVLVDVERGRTIKGWLPRRLGGGLGGTRRGGPEVNLKHSGREENRDDRYMDRDRERPERPERRRSRSRSRERRHKSRSRSRDRHRSDRHKRERSRDRERNRDIPVGAGQGDVSMDISGEAPPDGELPRKERRRSRSRDRKRSSRRSRSRDRERKRRDHDRERDRGDRESRRERGTDREERVIKEPVEPIEPVEPVEENFNNTGYEGEFNYNNNGESSAYDGY